MKITNVKIFNHDSVIENADIEVVGSKIVKITPIPGVGENIVVPGFIDLHIHGFRDKDCMDSMAAVEFVSKELKTVGTTSFMPTAMTESIENINKSLKDISEAKEIGARILGTHLEGPFISFEKKGAHNEHFLLKPTKELIDNFYKASNETIRKMTIAPEIFSDELIAHLSNLNIIISVGHSDGSASDVARAAKYGATSGTHLWNAMTGVANRNAGIVEGILINKQVYGELICDLIHVDKDAIDLSIKSKGVDKIIAVTDALKISGLPDGDSVSGGLEVTKNGLRITVKGTDTIAGSGITMHDNFKNLIKLGYDIKDVVAMTSYNQAQHLKLDCLGEVKENKEADLIIMDKEYNIKQVLVKGE